MSIENKSFSVYVFTKNGVDTLIDVIDNYLKDQRSILINLSGSAKSQEEKLKNYAESLNESNITINMVSSDLKDSVKRDFLSSEVLIFISATGIAIRLIAPLVESKLSDPAVIVMDELGKNTISLLSGHLGGANEITEYIAKAIDSNPVITTATDVNETGSFDGLIKHYNASPVLYKKYIKEVNSLMIEKKRVAIVSPESEFELVKYGGDISSNFARGFINEYKYDEALDDKTFDKIIVISTKKRFGSTDDRVIQLVPRVHALGTGCRKDLDESMYLAEFDKFTDDYNINRNSIIKIGSINIKENEKCILELAKDLNITAEFFTSDEMSEIDYEYEESKFVKETVGVGAVAEPVAWILSSGNVIIKRVRGESCTFSVGRL